MCIPLKGYLFGHLYFGKKTKPQAFKVFFVEIIVSYRKGPLNICSTGQVHSWSQGVIIFASKGFAASARTKNVLNLPTLVPAWSQVPLSWWLCVWHDSTKTSITEGRVELASWKKNKYIHIRIRIYMYI